MLPKDICFDDSSSIRNIISTFDQLIMNGNYVFRGYGKESELYPNIIRDKDLRDVETDLLKDFEKYGSCYFNASTPIDFMSYAQHFGLPTRLLDFTYNPYIALSFALYMPKSSSRYSNEQDGYYYYIRYASIDDNIRISSLPLKEDLYNSKITRTDSLAIRSCQAIDKITNIFGENSMNLPPSALTNSYELDDTLKIKQKIKDRTILFIDPNQSNQRIIMQQGLFMFPYTLDKEEHIDILNRNSATIKIHKKFRNDLIAYLDTLGYNTFRLMPDLSSICEAVKRRTIDKRSNESNLFKKTKKNQ